jgi:YggT family protein
MDAALLFLTRTLFDLYLLTFLLRFIFQWIRSDFYNPFAQFILRVTNPLVIPARRVIPAAGGVDMATLVVMLLLQLAATNLLLVIAGVSYELWDLLRLTALRTVSLLLWLYFVSLLLYVILSWVSPAGRSPVSAMLFSLNAPLLRPVQRLLPPIGGLDLSPLVVLIVLQALMIALPLPGFLR